MLDEHNHIIGGVHPILFSNDFITIESYPFFVLLGIILGVALFLYISRKDKSDRENMAIIGLAAIVGGAVGAKLPLLFLYWNEIFYGEIGWVFLFSGRTITGGLIGGVIGVVIAKKIFSIRGRKGNYIAPAAALGIAIGRIGCFMRGCCSGVETTASWAVDFGDGIMRHPVQLYEFAFMLLTMGYLLWKLKQNPKAGSLFDEFLLIYFTWRFVIEFIRIEPVVGFLSVYQWISLLVVCYVFAKRWYFGRVAVKRSS